MIFISKFVINWIYSWKLIQFPWISKIKSVDEVEIVMAAPSFSKNSYSGLPNRRSCRWLIFQFVSIQDILIPIHPPINYWEKFPTQTNFFKQYTYPDFFAIFARRTACLYCVLFCKFV